MKITCPGCGANVTFLPNKQKCYCEYCGSLIETKKILNNLEKQQEKIKDEKQYDEYSCSTCGAKLVLTDGSILTDCVYCGSRQLTKTKSPFYHKPVEIIPFKVDRNFFLKNCYEYIKKSKEIPSDYKKKINMENIIVSKGIYIPCKKDWFRIKSNIKTKIYYANMLKTKNKYACYEADIQKEVLALQDASIKISDNILEQIEDYDFKQIQKFNPAFLTGFIVENANEGEEAVRIKSERKCIDTIKQDINEKFKEDKRKIGVIQKLMGDIDFKTLSSSNVLLPVWFARLGNLEFVMNGQTGKLYCISPYTKPQYKYISNEKIGKKRLRIDILIAILLFAGIPLAYWLIIDGGYYSSIFELIAIILFLSLIIFLGVAEKLRPEVKKEYVESSERSNCPIKIQYYVYIST